MIGAIIFSRPTLLLFNFLPRWYFRQLGKKCPLSSKKINQCFSKLNIHLIFLGSCKNVAFPFGVLRWDLWFCVSTDSQAPGFCRPPLSSKEPDYGNCFGHTVGVSLGNDHMLQEWADFQVNSDLGVFCLIIISCGLCEVMSTCLNGPQIHPKYKQVFMSKYNLNSH